MKKNLNLRGTCKFEARIYVQKVRIGLAARHFNSAPLTTLENVVDTLQCKAHSVVSNDSVFFSFSIHM